MNHSTKPDQRLIEDAIGCLFDTQSVIELRAIHQRGRKRTDAGYFDAGHRAELVQEAIRLNNAGAAVYVVMNRLDPHLLYRCANRVQEYATDTATDANVTRRRWLLLDFDPVRPKNTSATEAQLTASRHRARECYSFLRSEGWPEPTCAESGNGIHLLYPIDLVNDESSKTAVKGALEGLAERFDDPQVKIDTAVFNAGRITKLYGVVSNKGDNLPEAPWRISRIVKAGGRERLVSTEQLLAVAPDTRVQSAQPLPAQTFDLGEFLSRLGIGYSQDNHEGRERYKLDHCPFNPDHSKAEAAIFRWPSGMLGFKCQHNSCADKHWQDVRALIDGPKQQRIADVPDTVTVPKAVSTEAPGRIAYRRIADVHAKPIQWLWPGRIARGKVSMLAGNPGLGKSQIAACLAAIVTTGGLWPVDRSRCEPGSVVILSAEDDAADTIRPRLEAAGADLSRVYSVDDVINRRTGDGAEVRRAFNLKSDLARLAAMLDEIGDVALVIIDPITAYLGTDTDSHRNSDIRALLAPLGDIAAAHGTAIVCVSHLNKGGGGSEALLRVSGSLAFVAAARAAFLITKDKEDESRRLFLPMKNNIGNDQTGFAFTIQSRQVSSPAGCIHTSRVVWESQPVTVTADEAMAAQPDPEERSALEDAKSFLEYLLRNGPVSAKQIFLEARDAGHSERTIRRAKKALGIVPDKEGMREPWTWALPPKVAKHPQDGQPKCLDAFGTFGHLRPEIDPISDPDAEVIA